MGTSGTESCEGCLQTQLKHLPLQLALKMSLVRLMTWSLCNNVSDADLSIHLSGFPKNCSMFDRPYLSAL